RSSECEWKQGHDEASEMVAPLTAAHLTDVGLLMEAGEDASVPAATSYVNDAST
ncbi:MAG: hypothetical protein QOF63_3407, partial [Thermoanaerobaculia bacterium]|nr:hypothetical protein [Thermoanaerobaculia bacterium]